MLCEVYDDTSAHAYDVALEFLTDDVWRCEARCADYSPTNFLDFKVVIDANRKHLTHTMGS